MPGDPVSGILASLRAAGQWIVPEMQAKEILRHSGFSVPEDRLAGSPEEAVRQASGIGYPVALKVHSRTITHKSDLGGVLVTRQTQRQ